MIARIAIVEAARSWLGVRWKHQGQTRNGVDCLGLIGCVAADVGISNAWLTDESAEFKGYGRHPDTERIATGCARYFDPVQGVPRIGDVLLMRFDGDPMHFGILSAVAPNYIIHAHAFARKVVENRVDDVWRSRIVRAYSFRGVE